MKYCKKCGREVLEEQNFCTSCGSNEFGEMDLTANNADKENDKENEVKEVYYVPPQDNSLNVESNDMQAQDNQAVVQNDADNSSNNASDGLNTQASISKPKEVISDSKIIKIVVVVLVVVGVISGIIGGIVAVNSDDEDEDDTEYTYTTEATTEAECAVGEWVERDGVWQFHMPIDEFVEKLNEKSDYKIEIQKTENDNGETRHALGIYPKDSTVKTKIVPSVYCDGDYIKRVESWMPSKDADTKELNTADLEAMKKVTVSMVEVMSNDSVDGEALLEEIDSQYSSSTSNNQFDYEGYEFVWDLSQYGLLSLDFKKISDSAEGTNQAETTEGTTEKTDISNDGRLTWEAGTASFGKDILFIKESRNEIKDIIEDTVDITLSYTETVNAKNGVTYYVYAAGNGNFSYIIGEYNGQIQTVGAMFPRNAFSTVDEVVNLTGGAAYSIAKIFGKDIDGFDGDEYVEKYSSSVLAQKALFSYCGIETEIYVDDSVMEITLYRSY